MKTEQKKNAELRISFLDGKMMEKKKTKTKSGENTVCTGNIH